MSGWAALAVEADEHATYLESRDEHSGAWRNKAALYRRTVEALAMEERTGQAHCVCCLKPASASKPAWRRAGPSEGEAR